MPDQIPEKEKERRLAILAALDRRMRAAYEQSREGKEAEVLFEEITRFEGKSVYTGYSREYIRVYAESAEDLRGQVRRVVVGKHCRAYV